MCRGQPIGVLAGVLSRGSDCLVSVLLQADSDGWTFSINPTSLQYQAMGFDSVVSDATLRYNYTSIPEPGTLRLLISGLALLGLRPKP